MNDYDMAEVLQLIETATPTPKKGEVLIHNLAAGVNFSDILRRRNTYFMPTPLSYVLGSEAVGEIVEVGAGICHQYSELNGWFNPRQNQQEALMKIKMIEDLSNHDQAKLYYLRTQLVRAIDPLNSEGNALQSVLMDCNRIAMGEMEVEKLISP